MGFRFRFRRSAKMLSGVRLNFDRRDGGRPWCGRGAAVNLGRRGTQAGGGLPGSGLSDRERLDLPGTRSWCGRGAAINLGRRGTHVGGGLPGSGLSDRERLDLPAHPLGARGRASRRVWLLGVILALWLAGLLLG